MGDIIDVRSGGLPLPAGTTVAQVAKMLGDLSSITRGARHAAEEARIAAGRAGDLAAAAVDLAHRLGIALGVKPV